MAAAVVVGAVAPTVPKPIPTTGPASLPVGSMLVNKNGTTYYLSGNTWFQPMYGANGVHYQVVTAPQ